MNKYEIKFFFEDHHEIKQSRTIIALFPDKNKADKFAAKQQRRMSQHEHGVYRCEYELVEVEIYE